MGEQKQLSDNETITNKREKISKKKKAQTFVVVVINSIGATKDWVMFFFVFNSMFYGFITKKMRREKVNEIFFLYF